MEAPLGMALERLAMRVLGPAMVVSVALWASLAWCFVAARALLGCDHMHLSARDFGTCLLLIDISFGVAIIWHDRIKPRNGGRYSQ